MKSPSSERGPMEEKEGSERETTPVEPLLYHVDPPQAPHPTLPNDIEAKSKAGEQACDPSDQRSSDSDSDSESQYKELLITETLPNIGQYYSCKEHSDIWDNDLKGIIISHFEPFHSS